LDHSDLSVSFLITPPASLPSFYFSKNPVSIGAEVNACIPLDFPPCPRFSNGYSLSSNPFVFSLAGPPYFDGPRTSSTLFLALFSCPLAQKSPISCVYSPSSFSFCALVFLSSFSPLQNVIVPIAWTARPPARVPPLPFMFAFFGAPASLFLFFAATQKDPAG